MRTIIAAYKGEMLTSHGAGYVTMVRSIVGQQISVKAADSIWQRFAALTNVDAETITKTEDEALRSIGLSRQKINYIRHITQEWPRLEAEGLHEMDDERLKKALTSLKGVGRWTAEMFMIFHLLRPDVWPVQDIGLIKGIEKHYGPDHGPFEKGWDIEAFGNRFRPWRSVATWYFWRSLDPIPVEY